MLDAAGSERVRALPRGRPRAPRGRVAARAGRAGMHELPQSAGRGPCLQHVPRLGGARVPTARPVLLPRGRRARRRPRRSRPGFCLALVGSRLFDVVTPSPARASSGGATATESSTSSSTRPSSRPGASYDATSGACAVSCHNRGGARSRPKWDETTPMGCNDCHRSPPAGHFPGPCTNCHQEPNAAGTALRLGPLHVNGRVDLGDGSGKCGACHGRGDDPWPSAGAHPAHESPSIAAAIACATCHPVPATVIDAVHLDGVIHVSFSGLALARGSLPQWDGTSCSQVACHGANLPDPPAMPAWNDTLGRAAACGTCHGIPPTQHTASTSCDRATCHGSEIMQDPSGSPLITASGKAVHVDGVIEFGH